MTDDIDALVTADVECDEEDGVISIEGEDEVNTVVIIEDEILESAVDVTIVLLIDVLVSFVSLSICANNTEMKIIT